MNEKTIQDLQTKVTSLEEELKAKQKQIDKLGEIIVSLIDAGNNLTYEMGRMNWDIIANKAEWLLKGEK